MRIKYGIMVWRVKPLNCGHEGNHQIITKITFSHIVGSYALNALLKRNALNARKNSLRTFTYLTYTCPAIWGF